MMLKLIAAWFTFTAVLRERAAELVRDRERGDENITKALYAALVVSLGLLIAGAITAFVNGKLPLIGGH